MYKPSRTEFKELAQDATVVPIVREMVADRLTPVVAFATVGGAEGSYLLESVVGGEKWARYSFVGFAPDMIVRGVADRFERVQAGHVHTEQGVDPWQRLREILSAHRPSPVTGLPRFWGGAVGYTSYDAVRTFEPTVGEPNTPDSDWEFCYSIGGTLLIFDNVKGTVSAVVPAFVRDGDIEGAYDRATAKIDEAIELLANPKMPRQLEPPKLDRLSDLPPSSFEKPAFCEAVEKAKKYIAAGDIFQVVFSQRFRVPIGDVDVFDVYRAMRIINPSPYMYFLRFEDRLVAGAES